MCNNDADDADADNNEDNNDDEMAKEFTLEEVAQKNDKKAAWIVIHDKVYDITKFAEEVGDVRMMRRY